MSELNPHITFNDDYKSIAAKYANNEAINIHVAYIPMNSPFSVNEVEFVVCEIVSLCAAIISRHCL